jgi:pimeloyl-ACP methyl ester carboxylesterase
LPQRPIVTIDLPGHGESTAPGRCVIEDYTQDVLSFLDANGWSQIDLAGHSMGGAISQCLAATAPATVRRLVLLATGARLKVFPILFDLLPGQPEMAFGAVRQFGFGPDARPEIVEASLQQMLACDPLVARHDFEACRDWNAGERLTRIVAPTLVVAGEVDQLTPARWNENLAAGIAGARYVLMMRTGHMIPLEREHELAALLVDFLGD